MQKLKELINLSNLCNFQHRIQIFRDNWNCYALSIFRGFILLALSDNDEHMLMRQRFAYWVKRANNGASAMEEANRAEDWGGPIILSPLSFSDILRSAYYWPFFPFKKPCPRLTVIKNGEDLIDQKQAPCSCLDSCLASFLQRFCFASFPRVVCSYIRHLEVTPFSFPHTTSKRLLRRPPWCQP